MPLPNTTVTFTAPGSGASGTFVGGRRIATATTNASGIATAATFTANAIAGSYTITVTFASLSVSFTLTNINPAAIAVERGSGQSTTITRAFGTALVSAGHRRGRHRHRRPHRDIHGARLRCVGHICGGVAHDDRDDECAAASRPRPRSRPTRRRARITVTATVTGVGTLGDFALTNRNPGRHRRAGRQQSAGDHQHGFPTRLTARVTDAGGAGIAGLVVTFTVFRFGRFGPVHRRRHDSRLRRPMPAAMRSLPSSRPTPPPAPTPSTPPSRASASPAAFTLTNLAPIAAHGRRIARRRHAAVDRHQRAHSARRSASSCSDVNGIVLTNYPVTFTVNAVGGAGATFAGGRHDATGNTNASGIAHRAGADRERHRRHLHRHAAAGSVTFTFTLTNVAPASIATIAGTPQVTLINTNFGTQLAGDRLDGVEQSGLGRRR